MIAVKDVPFSVECTGEVTGNEYKGAFRCAPILSHAQQLERDRLRRELLGQMADSASPRAQNQASLLSEIAARLSETPSWWKDSQNGLALYDDNPIAAIYGECMEAEKRYKAEIIEKGKKAKSELEKVQPTQ